MGRILTDLGKTTVAYASDPTELQQIAATLPPAAYPLRPRRLPMSWLNRVRNKIPFLPKRETAENLWHKCPECDAMVFNREYEENLFVCPRCEHHGRIGATRRFELLMDPGYTVLPPPQVREDPLKFRDSKRYTDRIKAARQATGEPDAFLNARGTVEGRPAVVGVQDFAFMGGSMGIAVGTAFIHGVRAAVADKAPYIIFTASGGARMQEAVLSLMQLPRTTVAIRELKEKIEQISAGGNTALFAGVSKGAAEVRKFLDADQARLYEIIWKRAIASQMADAELEKTTATISMCATAEPHTSVRISVLILSLSPTAKSSSNTPGANRLQWIVIERDQRGPPGIDCRTPKSARPGRHSETNIVPDFAPGEGCAVRPERSRRQCPAQSRARWKALRRWPAARA